MNAVKKSHMIIFIWFLVNNWLLLFSSGIYWDDWTLFNMSSGSITKAFEDNGGIPMIYFHNFINQFQNPPLASHIINFLFSLFSVLLVYEILSRFVFATKRTALYVTLLYIVLPLNVAGFTMIVMPTKIALLNFYIGVYFLFRYDLNRKTVNRFASLIAFFVSFLLPSVIPFYISFITLYLFFFSKYKNLKEFILVASKKLDFFIVPIIAIFLHKIFLSPSADGIHGALGYNVPNIHNLIYFPSFFKHSFIELFTTSICKSFILYGTGLFIFLFSLIQLVFYKLKLTSSNLGNYYDYWRLLLSGIVLFFSGAFVYVLAGKIPLMEWNTANFQSRFQVLLPIGLCFMIISLVELSVHYFRSTDKSKYIYGFLFFIFFSTNQFNLLEYQKDYYKQMALLGHFKGSDVVRNNHTFIIDDKTTAYNAFHREINFYEYTGLLKRTFNSENRLAITVTNVDKLNKWFKKGIKEFDGRAEFSLSSFNFDHFDYRIEITNGAYPLNVNGTIELMVNSVFNKMKYERNLINILKFKEEPIVMNEKI